MQERPTVPRNQYLFADDEHGECAGMIAGENRRIRLHT